MKKSVYIACDEENRREGIAGNEDKALGWEVFGWGLRGTFLCGISGYGFWSQHRGKPGDYGKGRGVRRDACRAGDPRVPFQLRTCGGQLEQAGGGMEAGEAGVRVSDHYG